MAKEEELKRVDLKVNVSCCDGCRRKVMKAMSLKGVLRTEIHPSLDRVTVVGNVDTTVLVKKLAKVRKIAEVVPQEEQQKKRDGDGGKDRAEKSKRKDDGKDTAGDKVPVAAAAYKSKDCHKCAHQQSAARGDDAVAADQGKAPSSKGDRESAFKEDGDGFVGAKSFAPDHAAATHAHPYQYHRAEPPTMAVPAQQMPYYAAVNVAAPSYYVAAPSYYGGGYYAMPPPVPPMPMPMAQQQQMMMMRPQPSRFDVDYFNEDNTVGCSVM
ncbi:unnamed protein product [Alopecurus aequalis]